MFKKLLFFSLFIAIAYMLTSSFPEKKTESEEDAAETFIQGDNTTLKKSADAGQGYVDSFIFFGESTTYHLKSRGVLSGGVNTLQVWAPKSGTLMLDQTTSECRIFYPDSKEEIELTEAMTKKKPKYILLTFGLNGAVGNISKGSDYFKDCYKKLISSLQKASPESVIMLQSCFPISSTMDTSGYSVDAKTLNSYIDITNQWTAQLAYENALPYLNTAEVLKDEDGFLKSQYDSGDGFHLNTEAYRQMLLYMRTHAYGGTE